MSSLAQNIATVKARIASAVRAGSHLSTVENPKVQLVAVSKTRPAAEIRAAHTLGLTHFGENYLQDALEKIQQLNDLTLVWHFIGALQSNKTAPVAAAFDWVHTIERIKIARRLSEQRPHGLTPLNLCIQVNLDGEPSKSGIAPEAIPELAAEVRILPRVRLRGLMFIPAPQADYESQLQSCCRAATLYKDLKQGFPEIDTLSLGMSADLEAAIAAGSTMVRIGTDIFGARNRSMVSTEF